MAAAAAEPPPLTPEILHGTAARAPGLAGVQWHPDGRRVTYLRRGRELSAFEVRTGRERPLLALESAQPASFWDYRWSPDGRRLVVPSGDDLYILQEGRAPLRITRGHERAELPDFSPDGSRLAYVRSGDLYVYDLSLIHI